MRTLLVSITWLCLSSFVSAQQPSVSADVSPNPVGTNQGAELTITINNGEPAGVPQPALPAPLQVAGSVTTSRQMAINNGVASMSVSFAWVITSPQAGTFTIPPMDVAVGGKTLKTKELTLEVVQGTPSQKPSGRAAGQDNGLGKAEPILQLTMPKTEFYQGEIVPVVASLYILNGGGVNLRRVGLIEVEKNDLAIQRFPQQYEQSYETLGNRSYTAFTYRSTLSALKAGKINVGPARVDLILGVVSGRGMFGFMEEQQRKVTATASEIAINVLPLPIEGKPKGFGGAVGDFTMTASLSNTEAMVGDPVAVDVQIQGSGNFDAIDAPKLSDAKGWKIYPARRYNIDNSDPNTADLMNRRIGYNNIIVPEKEMALVPPFEFTFFSPRTKQYTTLRTQPIPITIKPSPTAAAANAPAASSNNVASNGPKAAGPAPAPEADITDILMTVSPTPRWAAASKPLFSSVPFITLNALLALGVAGLVVVTLLDRARQRRANSPARALEQLLAQVQTASLSESEFYTLAARYVHLATKGQVPEEARPVMAKYEALNFAGPTAGSSAMPSGERSQVVGLLKKIKPLMAVIVLMTIAAQGAEPGAEAYQKAVEALQKNDFKTAQQQAEAAVEAGNIGADVFTLLGHAAYKLGQPGTAAMWYQRARLFPNSSQEVRQNLRHIHDRVPFFTFDNDQWLSRIGLFFSRNTWGWLATLGFWVCVGAIVLAWRSRRWVMLSAVPVGAILGTLGIIGWLVRPSYEHIEPLAFVTDAKAQAHTAATQVSGSVINVPQGSVVRRLEQRGNWTYVEIPQNDDALRGWLPSNQLKDMWPYDAAKLP